MFDRNSSDSAAAVFSVLFADSAIRQLCVQALAESVATAHATAPQAWSITLFPNTVRLNVGRIEALAYFTDSIHCIIDSQCIPDGLRQRKDVDLIIGATGVLPSVPVSAVCNFPADLAGELFPLLRSSHESLIRAAGSARGTPYRSSYSPGVIEFLSSKVGRRISHPSHYNSNDDSVFSSELSEGASRQVTLNIYERNLDARQQCIAHHGCRCMVCGFDFAAVYGELGRGFIHVHHLKPLSEIREEYEVDPVVDLRPVCPNCHAMLHRGTEMIGIDDLRQRINCQIPSA